MSWGPVQPCAPQMGSATIPAMTALKRRSTRSMSSREKAQSRPLPSSGLPHKERFQAHCSSAS
jgi:hypothetical protein